MKFSLSLLSLVSVAVPASGTSRPFGFGVDSLRSQQHSFHKNVFGFDVASTSSSSAYNKRRAGADGRHLVGGTNSSQCCVEGEVEYCEPVKSLYYKGVVDNFATAENQVEWEGKQRYWINEELWGGPGYPIFVFIGGEWEESCGSLMSGSMFMYDLATEHSGLLVDVEHRFYGDSYPFNDTTLESLQYLTSDQALADLARLLEQVKETYNAAGSQVITIGGSYSGNLAAWFRLKYPSTTSGSIASSAPVMAELNFEEYMEVVSRSIDYYGGASCNSAFRAAAETVMSKTYVELASDFKACAGTLSTSQDFATLLSNLMGGVQGVVQYNNPASWGITQMCGVMLNSTDPYAQFVALNTGHLWPDPDATCMDVSWASMTAMLADTTALDSASRQWTYQTCNQYGYYQTADSPNQPFSSWTPMNVQFYTDTCAAIFDGWTALPEIDDTNRNYGATAIAGTNIIFPTGTIDPWHVLGVVNTTVLPQPTEQSLLIVGTSHCADLHAPSDTDLPSMTAARAVISSFVTATLAGAAPAPAPTAGGGGGDDDKAVIGLAVALGLMTLATAFLLFDKYNVTKNTPRSDSKTETFLPQAMEKKSNFV